jgi:hypothetical protein
MTRHLLLLAFAPLALALAAIAAPDKNAPFTITVVDEQTGRGVPLVELRTVHQVAYYTDNHGVVAFHEPVLMGRRVFFSVKSHGYEYAKDGFGFRGKALDVTPGGSATLKIKRQNLAERLYRVTGADLYRDSVLAGRPVSIKQPLLNGLVFGSDSVVNAVYRSRVYWFWGDTNRPAYPLGNFHVPGATSALPGHGGLDPEVGVDLTYFVDGQGFARPTAQMPGDGPTWIDGLVVVRDGNRERLFASYVKVRPPLTIYARGLAEFDDATERFRQAAEFPLNAPAHPGGHPFIHVEDAFEHVYFAKPYPLTRARATPSGLKDLAAYETYTCLKEGSRLDRPEVERGPDGRPVYAWKRNTPAVGPAEQKKLISKGLLRPHEGLLQLQDRTTGKAVLAHGGSVSWNPYRQRWTMITVESAGTSFLGEVWYAEADTPTGPWTYAVKVVTHERYSFYNPKQHPMFEKDGGRVIFFEGTYTHTFSGNPEPTPRYDYNQVMYKLDLADARLALPVAVYRLSVPGESDRFAAVPAAMRHTGQKQVAFFALDRPAPGTVPVTAEPSGALRVGAQLKSVEGVGPGPMFYALPGDAVDPPATTQPLYELRHEDGVHVGYTTNATLELKGYRRTEKPVCRVWRNPRSGPS